jgi:hypothetical protein
MKTKRTFHNAGLKSDRIQRVLKVLKEMKLGLTTMLIGRICHSTRPSSDISEANAALRQSGSKRWISCEYRGLSANGRKMYNYRLELK